MTEFHVLPEHLTNFGPQWILLQLAGVVLLLGGATAIWGRLRPWLSRHPNPPFWVLLGEAAVAVPWLLFLLLFPAALLGAFRPALVAAQLVLAAFGLAALRRGPRPGELAQRLAGLIRESWLNVAALIAVALFVAWGWLMPYPESFQGHHHFLLNIVSDLWRSGAYEPSPEGVAHEVLGTPPAFAFFLSLFSVPGIDAIASRPVFLLPGVFALVTFQLMRGCINELGGAKSLGAIAFLLVAFSYYAAFDFTEISPDLFAPVVIALAVFHLSRYVRRGEIDWVPFALLLPFTWIVRKQLFVLLLAVVLVVWAVRLLRIGDVVKSLRDPGPARAAGAVILMLLPAVAWTVFAVANYGDPFFPYESRAGSFGLSHVDELFGVELAGHNQFLSSFLPVYRDEPGTMLKNAFAGLSVSVLFTLALVGFFVFGRRIGSAIGLASVRRLGAALLIAFLIVLYLFFPEYPKYAHYGAYLMAPFAALFLGWAASLTGGLRPAVLGALASALLVVGVGFWAFNNWGHAASDRSFTNARYLWPGYGDPMDRVAQSAVRTRSSLEIEFAEYEAAVSAVGDGGEILYAEMEPGGLVPSLADREYLGEVYFLDGEIAEPVVAATTIRDLEKELEDLDVRFVYRPGKSHPELEGSLLLKRLASPDAEAEYLVPTEELSSARRSD